MYRETPVFSKSAMRFALLVSITLMALLVRIEPVHGQVRIDIISPQLEDGLAEIEAIVDAQISAAAAELETYADPFLEKPEIMRAFADAGAAAAGMYSAVAPPDRDTWELVVGSVGAFTSFSFDPEEVEDRLEAFTEEDDLYLGAAAYPLYFSLAGPAHRILPGLRARISGGYLRADAAEVQIRGFGLALRGDYPVLHAIPLGRVASFSGVSLLGGFSWLKNVIALEVSPGLITEEFSIDPDGSGPIFAQDVSVEVEPEVTASLETSVFSLGTGLVTGIELLDFLELSGGIAGELVFGNTALNLSADDEVVLTGYLSDLVVEGGDARLIVSGGTDPVSPTVLQPAIFGALTWRVAPYRASIPVTWRSVGGLAAGIEFGVSL